MLARPDYPYIIVFSWSLGFMLISSPELCCSTKQSEKAKELIIPLIVKNRWNKQGQKEGNGETATQDKDSVDSQAVKELIEGQNLWNL